MIIRKNPTRNVVRKRAIDDSKWTAEKDKVLRDLLATGLSAQATAIEMGVTKNAVCGRASRLGIVYGRTAERKREASRRNFVAPPKPHRTKKASPSAPVEGMKDVVRHSDEPAPISARMAPPEDDACRWVHGDPSTTEWRHCGHKQKENSVYCGHHHSRAYHHVPFKGNVIPMKLGVRRR